MSQLLLSEIWRYPVKSLRGSRHRRLEVASRGFAFDRHWMLVSPDGKFLTQRQEPRMALIRADIEGGLLRLGIEPDRSLALPVTAGGDSLEVQVWNDRCRASGVPPVVDRWLSDQLGRPVRMVWLPHTERRQVDQGYALPGDQTGFSDGFPFLLISQASLDELNRQLARPVPMERFRPNLVVTGCAPHAEDDWQRIRIGDLSFRVVKPCSRCAIPSVDLETGQKHPQMEPIRTLMRYRSRDNKVYFGQNLLHDGQGWLQEGMAVEILG